MPPPTGFFQFVSGLGRAFLQTKFLAVGSSLEHLSIKRDFQIGPTVLALKLEKGRDLGVATIPPPPTEQKLAYFSNHKDDIQSKQILL